MKKNVKQQQKAVPVTSRAIKNAKARARKKERERILGSRDPRFNFSWGGGSIPTPWGDLSPGNIGLVTDEYASAMGQPKKGGKGRSSGFQEPGGGCFASRNQPQGGMVGLSEFTEDIQMVMPRVVPSMNSKGESVDLCFGTEFLSSISNDLAGSAPGDLLATLLINPSNFSQTRLVEFSKLYQRYRFRKLNFYYKPIANSTQSGQIIGFGDYDPDNIISTNSPDNISLAAAHLGQRTGKIWETVRFPFGVVDDYTTLYVDTNAAEKRLSYQGVYYLLAASDIESDIGPLGNLYVDYEVEFSIPLLQPTSQQISLAVIDGNTSIGPQAPFGTNPQLTSAIARLPPSSLTFSLTDEDADLFWDTAANSGLGSLTNNATVDGDVWLYIMEISFTNGGFTSGVNGHISVTPNMSFTNALESNVNIATNPGKQDAQSSLSSTVMATYDVMLSSLVKVINSLPVEMTYTMIGVNALFPNWEVNGSRLWVQRLYRGAATPPVLKFPVDTKLSLDFLRRKEVRKRAHRKLAMTRRAEAGCPTRVFRSSDVTDPTPQRQRFDLNEKEWSYIPENHDPESHVLVKRR